MEEQEQVEGEEAKLQKFIQANLPMLDSFTDPAEKAKEIVKAFRFYFTEVYRGYVDAEEVKEEKSS